MRKVLVVFISFLCLPTFAQNVVLDELYSKAEQYYKEGKYSSAVECLDQYVLGDGDPIRAKSFKNQIMNCMDLLTRAEDLFDSRKFAEALSQYEALQRLNPTNPQLSSRMRRCRTAIADVNKTKLANLLKPDFMTLETGFTFGSDVAIYCNYTYSYFLVGLGCYAISDHPIVTETTNLVNSGYTGNFKKSMITEQSKGGLGAFLDIGGCIKYFSISCRVGFFNADYKRRVSYSGSGYGLKDGDLDEFWGSYAQRSFIVNEEFSKWHLILSPQLRCYVPLKNIGVSFGLGYTFIPTLGCNAGLSGSIGCYYRFL